MVNVHSFTGDEARMAELMVELFDDMDLQVQRQEVEDGRANALATWAGAGGGPSLMFNGHMDTSYSGREPWLRNVPGFQPNAFERDGRLYGLGISNMKGALACYVEAVRALRDAGVRLRGDVLIAAVCGEIEKTQYGERDRRRVPRATRRARATSSRTAASPTCACSASRPRARSCSGTSARLWLRIRVHGDFIHTAFSEGQRDQNSILRSTEVLEAVQEWIPTWEDDPGERLPRREGDRQRRCDRGRLRLARLADAAPHGSVPRHPRAADEGDGGSHGARCWRWCASLASRFPDYGVEGEVYVTAPGAEIDESHELVAAIDGAHAEVFGERAGPRRDALVQRRVGFDPLRRSRR